MTTRDGVNISKQHPSSYQSLVALSETAEQNATDAGLPALLVELVKLRTSQINGCAFCLRLHTRTALDQGETTDRLAVLAAWRETALFSPQERSALALTEAITLIATTPDRDDASATALRELTDRQVSAVAWLATVMNAFNRVAITSRYPVEDD